MSLAKALAASGFAFSLAACAAQSPPVQAVATPDCRPLVARVVLSCFYGGTGAPLTQCEVATEEPVGCGIGPDALALYNGRVDMSGLFQHSGTEEKARWLQFNVYRDAGGRVGRKAFGDRGELVVEERLFKEN